MYTYVCIYVYTCIQYMCLCLCLNNAEMRRLRGTRICWEKPASHLAPQNCHIRANLRACWRGSNLGGGQKVTQRPCFFEDVESGSQFHKISLIMVYQATFLAW